MNGQENRHSKHWDQHQRIKVYQLVRAVGGQKLGDAGGAEEAGSDGDGEVGEPCDVGAAHPGLGCDGAVAQPVEREHGHQADRDITDAGR